MLMKVHNKGQVVIPSRVRQLLRIEIGDFVEIDFDRRDKKLKLTKPRTRKSQTLAGAFSQYKKHHLTFPTRAEMHEALGQGLASEK